MLGSFCFIHQKTVWRDSVQIESFQLWTLCPEEELFTTLLYGHVCNWLICWQNSNSIYCQTQCRSTSVQGFCVAPLKAWRSLSPSWSIKSKSHAMSIYLDPLRAAVQSAVSWWRVSSAHLQVNFFGGILMKGRWIWSPQGKPDEL